MDNVNNLTANTDQQMLMELSQQLLNSESVQQTADIIVEALYSKIQSFDCAFFRFEAAHKQLICISYASRENQHLNSFKLKPIALGAGVVGRTAETQELHNIRHRDQCDYWLDYVDTNVSELTVPIVYNDVLLGVIDLEDDREAYFDESAQDLVKSIADRVAKFLHHQILNEEKSFQLEQISYSDKRVRSKESYFSMLLEQLGDSIFILSPSGKIIDVNESCVLALGFSKQELIGQHIHKVEQISGHSNAARLYKTIKQNDTLVVEGTHTRKDGTRYHVEIKLATLSDNNIIAVARDVSKRHQTLKKLQTNTQFLEEVIKTTPDVIYAYDLDTNQLMMGGWRLSKLLGYSENQFKTWENAVALTHPEDFEAMKGRAYRILNSKPGETVTSEARIKDAKGNFRWLENHCVVFQRDDQGKPLVELGSVRDITEKKQLQKGIDQREKYYKALVENAFDGIALYDRNTQVVFCSGSALKLLDYGEEEVKQKTGVEFVYKDDVHLVRAAWDWIMQHPNQIYRIPEYRIIKKGGEPVWVENTLINLLDDPNVKGVISNFRDISYKKTSEQSLYKLSHYDSLTEIPNRTFLKKQIGRYISQAKKFEQEFSLIYFDVIQLSMINSAWGRLIGDEVLRKVVEVLQSYTEGYDFIARAGEDEFAVILRGKDSFETTKFVKNVLSNFDSLIKIEQAEVKVSIRAAIIRYPDDGDVSEELLSKAEITLRRVKSLPSQFAFYEADETEAAHDKLTLEKDLVQAINNDELMLYYQPKVCLASGEIDSVEALLRWNHPSRGFVSPALIIDIAEESSLIFRLTDWVLAQAIKQISIWQKQGNRMKVSVNLSVKDLFREQLMTTLEKTLKHYQVDPILLDLEITESAALADKERAVALLNSLKKMGVSISLDDFGTGYSSISYLTSLPVDLVKIDQSFIRKTSAPIVDGKIDNRLIIKNIIRLARSFHMKSLVEGVETTEQLSLLREYDCDLVQGYLFSEPRSAAELESLIAQGKVEFEKLSSFQQQS